MNSSILTRAMLSIVALGAIFCSSASSAIVAPTDISGHVLWLDGNDLDGNSVADSGVSGTPFTSWVDKSSGMGINSVTVPLGVGTNPTEQFNAVNGHSVARFVGGTDAKLDNGAFSLNTPYTIFTVVKASSTAGAAHIMSGINQGGTDEVLYRNGTLPRFYDGGAVDLPTTGTFDATNYHVFGVQVDPTGSNRGFFDLGVSTGHTWASSAGLDGLRIGNLSRGPTGTVNETEAWNGDIAEVIIYNRVLTNGSINPAQNEKADVVNYLSNKWNLGLVATPVVTLDATTLGLTNNQTVTTWGPATGVGTPTYRTNQTPNGKPAVVLDGTDNFGQISASLVPATASGDFVMVAVVKPQSIGAYHNIIDGDGGVRPMMWIDGSNKYEWNFNGGTSPTVGGGTQGWDIVIADSKNNLLYINSATANGSGRETVLYSIPTDFDLFGRNGGATFQGSVAELRLYNAMPDIPQLYNDLFQKWINVPEPSSVVLAGLAFFGLVVCKLRRRPVAIAG